MNSNLTEYREKNPWVIMNRDKDNLVVEGPGSNLPWHTYNHKLAKQVAKEVGGFAVRAKEALDYLMKKGKQ